MRGLAGFSTQAAYENYLGDFYLNDDALSLYFFDVPVGGGLLPGCQGLDPQSPLVTAFLPVRIGMHSTHRMFGCEIQEDGHSNSFWQFGYDGQDHVSLDMETLSWVSANPVALLTKRRMETEHCYAEYNKAYLEGPCLASLRRYLELGGQRFTRRGKVQPMAMQIGPMLPFSRAIPFDRQVSGE